MLEKVGAAIAVLAMASGPGVSLPIGDRQTDASGAHLQAVTLAIGQVAVMIGLLFITGHQYFIGQTPDDFLKSADLLLFAVYISQRVNLVQPVRYTSVPPSGG